MYEHFEHTADLGLRVRAAHLESLFADAAHGLTAMIVDNPAAIQPRESVPFTLSGTSLEYLLFDWLNALLYAFETRGLVFRHFAVRIADGHLTATAEGEKFDPTRHEPGHEVKAITYHQLQIAETAQGWTAEVIVDI